MRRSNLIVISSMASLLVAVAGAYSALETARLVEVVALLAGAFGAGAGLTTALHQRRVHRKAV